MQGPATPLTSPMTQPTPKKARACPPSLAHLVFLGLRTGRYYRSPSRSSASRSCVCSRRHCLQATGAPLRQLQVDPHESGTGALHGVPQSPCLALFGSPAPMSQQAPRKVRAGPPSLGHVVVWASRAGRHRRSPRDPLPPALALLAPDDSGPPCWHQGGPRKTVIGVPRGATQPQATIRHVSRLPESPAHSHIQTPGAAMASRFSSLTLASGKLGPRCAMQPLSHRFGTLLLRRQLWGKGPYGWIIIGPVGALGLYIRHLACVATPP
ncbi:hypothetical protein NDU88_006802 [Pleurodeles waltl]|uniref:Uncharacterized protein n=1 Tax=Pleurodeles waltl TaxID=8319 RepID=A0AAV7VQR6_PLEWA|nr:hypothetical protein NDU88_006802 [Pleurodeles waltl]